VASPSRAWSGCIAAYNLYINVGGFDIDHICQNFKARLAAQLSVVCRCCIMHQVGLRLLFLLLTWRNFQACYSVPISH